MSRYSSTGIRNKQSLPKRKNWEKSYGTTLYQIIPETNDDLHLIATEGDRLDLLANKFYGNPHFWWYIGKANGITTMNVPAGTPLRIPGSIAFAKGG